MRVVYTRKRGSFSASAVGYTFQMRVVYTELLANHSNSSVGYTFQMRVVYTYEGALENYG